ncbi:MAG: GNAT family N-acetyltransferase [Anaerolineae bacterium]|nr:GNAT family N-acetyltransferase [Anaerolineae bacterium]
MISKADMRRLYDRQQRIEIDYAGVRREVTPRTVRQIETAHGRSTVVYSQVDATNADETIHEEIAYFRSLDNFQNLEWKLFDYDQPADLKDRLIAHEFVAEDPDAVLILDLAELPPALAQPVTHDVRQVSDPAQLEDVRAITRAVWGDEDNNWLIEAMASTLRDKPEELTVYVIYVDGVPASYGRIDFHEGNDFAGLWGGSTLPEYRKRGLYTALVAVRAQEAIQRGARYLTIDASPMSRAVLEKFGFWLLAYAWECNYRITGD